MERDNLLKELMEMDFVALDLAMYLDTHPHDDEAIAKYNEAVLTAGDLRYEYEKKHGPLCSFRSLSGKCFNWIDEPWPWCESANFKLT